MPGKVKKFIVEADNQDQRLDIFLVEKLGLNRSQVQKFIANDLVKVKGKLPKKTGDRLKAGYVIEVEVEGKSEKAAKEVVKDQKIRRSEDQKIEIVKDEKDYLVINKPAGLLVHKTEANEPDTLAAWLVNKYPTIKKVGESPVRPGIVHRLDKEASGLLVVAKNQKMFEHLKKQFKDRTIDKEYLVLVHGVVSKDTDIIDFEIDRGKEGKMVARPRTDKFSVDKVKDLQEGKDAITEIFVEKRYARFTLLRVKIYTGRTNQIRVHLLAHSHPVVGDTLYYNRKLNRSKDLQLGRVFLHAAKLGFNDLKGERQNFESKLPKELYNFLLPLKINSLCLSREKKK